MSEYDASRAAYAATRRTDPRIAAVIERALGDARTVVNVGAGTGSYESPEREVIAVEPSATMRAQRRGGAAEAIDARAEALPFDDASVDAATAILTLHHWQDPIAGLRELRRVARGPVVVLTFDPDASESFWLVRDYLPELGGDRPRPLPDDRRNGGGAGRQGNRRARADPARLPRRLPRRVLAAARALPQTAVDPAYRPSSWTRPCLRRGLAMLRNDLDSGAWRRRYGGLLSRDELDVGYRLVVSP